MLNFLIKTASIFLFCAFLLSQGYALHASDRAGCVICGMFLDLYERTRYMISLDDGRTFSTCGLTCAAGIIKDHKAHLAGIEVADFSTGEPINARTAVYVEGSDIPGVMTYTSRLAFRSKAAATAFQSEHGGRLMTFDEALRSQAAD